ncbi:cystathionine beta-lyase [Sphingomonas piscis]|uniref:Cystathionine beta-lyase n=1 Tax=Sphingomonas piscis TaxID=2714943 RepID=A0A6G7YM14_9SPHN|nr:cystathionine beta-lyase [Sphingomonas piscis]QIK77784.1 cystathionine beta-lyase [Sphingomonas piscis]
MNDDQPSDLRPATRLVQAGRRKEWTGDLINVPVARTSTILFDSVAGMNASYPPKDGRGSYGRNGTQTHWSLAEALTQFEPGAAGTKLFPSGAAAVAMALLTVLKSGDELLMIDSAYGPTRSFCDDVLAKQGVTTIYYDPRSSPEEIAALCTDRTGAIFLESPGSLTFEVQDVPGICAMARDRGIPTLVDNTWATPLFFPAIENGVDLTILACTKYIGGHSDVMLGSVTTTERFHDALVQTYRSYGQHVSADDAFLASRGLRTLGVRLQAHQENALAVARWLKGQPQVDLILHPAFEECPGHEYWKRDFKGASGLFSFVLRAGGPKEAATIVDRFKLFGIGFSWGGYESLAIPTSPHRSTNRELKGRAIIRLQIGLEDPADLIADLEQAFTA